MSIFSCFPSLEGSDIQEVNTEVAEVKGEPVIEDELVSTVIVEVKGNSNKVVESEVLPDGYKLPSEITIENPLGKSNDAMNEEMKMRKGYKEFFGEERVGN